MRQNFLVEDLLEMDPGLQFEDCSVFRGTYGRVTPSFQHPEDAVMITRKPGDYDHVNFLFMSQLYPHHERFKIHD